MSTYSDRVWWAVRPLWYWRLLRLVLRSFWIAVTLAVCGWLLSRALGFSLPLIVWGAVGYAAFMVLLPTFVLWPIPARTLTRRLDAVFRLRDTLTTAGEVAERRPVNYVEWQLLRKAEATLRGVRRRLLRVRRVPWTDLALSLLAMVVLYACYLLAGALEPSPLPNLPAAEYALPPALEAERQVALPGLPPEMSEGAPAFAPQPDNVSDPNLSPEAAQQALDALTRALGENPVTQNAAEALAQGNALQAANDLRELAGSAGELAPQTLEQLADSLQAAAEDLQAAAPEAAQAIGQAAGQLDEAAGAPNQASQAGEALEALAQLVEGLDAARQPDARGQEGGGEGEGAGSGAGQNGGAAREERSAGTTERLQDEGDTVELPEAEAPEEGGILQPPERPGEANEQRDTPYTSTGAEGAGGTQPWDPLNFPWRLRNVIQRYFSPP